MKDDVKRILKVRFVRRVLFWLPFEETRLAKCGMRKESRITPTFCLTQVYFSEIVETTKKNGDWKGTEIRGSIMFIQSLKCLFNIGMKMYDNKLNI